MATPQRRMPKDRISTAGQRASGSTSRRKVATIETAHTGKGPIVSTMRHLGSPIAKSFSEALRIDTEAGSSEATLCATTELMHRSKQHLYWITSSAVASIASGIVSPSAAAVLRLT